MQITENQIEQILNTHNSLWNSLYDYDSPDHCLHYNDKKYQIFIPNHRGYASVVLPNTTGNAFLWITQNLNKSTYGSNEILSARDKDQDLRITWVVDTKEGQFDYRANIKTCTDFSGELIHGDIEYYTSFGTHVLWSSNPLFISQKSKH
jgi:hypothetical protein